MSHPYDALTPDTVITAIESLGLVSDLRILTLNSYENRVYQIGIDEAQPVIAKFYRPDRWSREAILEEHAFLDELHAAEIPVIAPLTIAGASLHRFNEFLFALFPRKGGSAPEPGDLDYLFRMGQLLGRLHGIAKNRDFRHRPTINIEGFAIEPSAQLLRLGFIPGDLIARYQDVVAQIVVLCRQLFAYVSDVRYLRTHGDCHIGNILCTRDDALFVVDFDDSRMGPAVQDIWMLLSGGAHEQRQQLDEVLSGYEDFNEFRRTELKLIEPLRALRMIHYTHWLASRWDDPAFPRAFTWFNTPAYWTQHLGMLEQQLLSLQEVAGAL
ncbi:MAG: serine/threonine protein kinase [Porticoccaceae bacterium]